MIATGTESGPETCDHRGATRCSTYALLQAHPQGHPQARGRGDDGAAGICVCCCAVAAADSTPLHLAGRRRGARGRRRMRRRLWRRSLAARDGRWRRRGAGRICSFLAHV